MMWGDESPSGLEMGTLDNISCRPSQPSEVVLEGFAAAGFWRDGALPMKAALMLEKS
jgi:hypothetical protein